MSELFIELILIATILVPTVATSLEPSAMAQPTRVPARSGCGAREELRSRG